MTITNFAYRKNSDAMKRSVLTSIILIISAIGLHAEGKQYIYNRISHKDGLTSTVNCIYKEKDGDVWIGTPAGLYNFNGYMLKPCGEHLFGRRKVFDIGADSENNLWVVTEKHILRKDRDADTFTKVSEEEHIFFCMTCDEEGIWFGSRDGLFRYTCSDKRLSHFCTLQDFRELCASLGIKIVAEYPVSGRYPRLTKQFPNLFAIGCVFVLSK